MVGTGGITPPVVSCTCPFPLFSFFSFSFFSFELLDLPKGKWMLRRELLEGPGASGVRVLPGLAVVVSFAGRGFGETGEWPGDEARGGDVARVDEDEPLTAVGELLLTEEVAGTTPSRASCLGAVSGVRACSGVGDA